LGRAWRPFFWLLTAAPLRRRRSAAAAAPRGTDGSEEVEGNPVAQ